MADIDIVPKHRSYVWLWIVIALAIIVVLWFALSGNGRGQRVGALEQGAGSIAQAVLQPVPVSAG